MAVSAPSGVTVARSGDNFTVSWKQGAQYSAQSAFDQLKGAGKYYKAVGAGETSTVWPIPWETAYYPTTSTKALGLIFGIKGARNGRWSGESIREFTISKPLKPTVTAELSSENENMTTFKYSIDWDGKKLNKDTTAAMFTNFKWWSVLLPNSDLNPEQVKNWEETGVNDNGVDNTTKEITESVVLEDNYSVTRYFKVVARGPAGDSEPAYAKHVYAIPNAPRIVKTRAVRLKNDSGYRVSVQWVADESNSRPIDSISIEYAITTPDSSHEDVNGTRQVKLLVPNISSWTSISVVKDASKSEGAIDGATFIIDQNELPDDSWIFVRVVAKHDKKISSSDITLVNEYSKLGLIEDLVYGLGRWDGSNNRDGVRFNNRLANPSGLSATITDNIATVTVTNNSNLRESIVGIYYRSDIDSSPRLIGIKPAGTTAPLSIELPDEGANQISLGAQAFLANYTPIYPKSSGVTEYALTSIRAESSGILWDDRPVPKPPSNIGLSSPDPGTIRITWDWSWLEANGVEISWADHPDAWESTNGPSTYNIENRRVNAWNISGLNVGIWHFKIRLYKTDGDATTYGTYSERKEFKLSSTPATPSLTITPDPAIVPPNGSVTCYWGFTAIEGDTQVSADICEAIRNQDGSITYGDIIGVAGTEQHKTLKMADLRWTAGSKHFVAVRVVTASGEDSGEWSIPKSVQVLDKPVAEITSTSLETITVVDDEEQSISHQQLSLTTLPLAVSASGAGEAGQVTYILERSGDYHLDRPDENQYMGFDGETVAIVRKSASNVGNAAADYSVSIGVNDLIGRLDDGAYYRLIAITQDSYGQTAQDSLEFAVHWSHQAVKPSATITIDKDNLVAFITPKRPSSGYASGDVCDIYRLSVDKPELIIENAALNTKYVDLYPTLGSLGGHRIVYKTSNGDYITESNEFAWTDYRAADGDILDKFATIIDFGDDRIVLPYDLSLSSKWSKDFEQTKYLGGSIVGDWNPAVERSTTVRTRIAVREDSELIETARRLAIYSGVCHVRTPDGSSFAANVEVGEDREEQKINMIASFTLEITRVDSTGFDGMPYSEWIKKD